MNDDIIHFYKDYGTAKEIMDAAMTKYGLRSNIYIIITK